MSGGWSTARAAHRIARIRKLRHEGHARHTKRGHAAAMNYVRSRPGRSAQEARKRLHDPEPRVANGGGVASGMHFLHARCSSWASPWDAIGVAVGGASVVGRAAGRRRSEALGTLKDGVR